MAVCEDDLTPAQVASVLDAVDADVLDRTELILTVFSKHAHSLEGTMQVHLAQLEYELTRMRGKGLVMSRLGAGVDMRGPGETKMEVDRRVVRKRIQTLRHRIDQMARTRRTQRAKRLRAGVPLIALAGYTNAGKSTLLNALTDAEVSVRDRLFETLDPTSRSFRYHDRDYVVTDTVGFIRKLPHQLVDAFASTLEETTLADVVLVIADASLDPSEIGVREKTVADVLDMIGSTAPRIVVFNKIDRLDEGKLARLRRCTRRRSSSPPEQTWDSTTCRRAWRASSTAPSAPCACCSPTRRPATCTVCAASPATCARSTPPDGVVFEARLPAAEAGRYARFRLEPEIPDEPRRQRRRRPDDRSHTDDQTGRRRCLTPACQSPSACSRHRRGSPSAPTSTTPPGTSTRRKRPRYRRSPAPSSAPASPWGCRATWRRSRCRAPASPPATASPSSTLRGSSTRGTAARCASSS